MRSSVAAWLPGTVVTALGAAFAVGGLSYGLTNNARMAPGMMPAVMGIAVVILGVSLVVAELRSLSRDREDPAAATADVSERTPVRVGGSDELASSEPASVSGPDPAADLADREAKHPLRPWFLFATMVVSLLVAPYLGLIPALVVGAFVMMKFIEQESWAVSILIAVLLFVASWFIFDDFLEVNLPWGVFARVV